MSSKAEKQDKLKEENTELRVKCNKLLNDNFLLAAENTNMKAVINILKDTSLIKTDKINGVYWLDIDGTSICISRKEYKLLKEFFG